MKGEIVLFNILKDRLTQAEKVARTTRDALEGLSELYCSATADPDVSDKIIEAMDAIDEGHLHLAIESLDELIESFNFSDVDESVMDVEGAVNGLQNTGSAHA